MALYDLDGLAYNDDTHSGSAVQRRPTSSAPQPTEPTHGFPSMPGFPSFQEPTSQPIVRVRQPMRPDFETDPGANAQPRQPTMTTPAMPVGGPYPDLERTREGPAPPQGGRWDQAWFSQNIGTPNTLAELVALEQKIVGAGGKLNKNASGQWNGKITTPDGRIVDVMIAAGLGGRGFTWDEGGGVGGTQNVFSDPATQEWERMLRGLVDRLNTPRPEGYTASQQELIATQALDPMERQRQQQKQNAIQRYASMGHGQNSGPLQMALADIDRQFDAMGAQARAGFAMNQIGLEDQRFNQNEQRAQTAVNTMFQIPQLGDQRFAQYSNFVNGNPVTQGQGIGGMLMNQNNMNQQQNSQFWQQLIAALMQL